MAENKPPISLSRAITNTEAAKPEDDRRVVLPFLCQSLAAQRPHETAWAFAKRLLQ